MMAGYPEGMAKRLRAREAARVARDDARTLALIEEAKTGETKPVRTNRGRRLKHKWVDFAIEVAALIYQNRAIKDSVELRQKAIDKLADEGIEIPEDKTAKEVAERVWSRMHD